ncbi:MAG: putative sulfate exporter family transporter [Alphaproteobacteria bacterium]
MSSMYNAARNYMPGLIIAVVIAAAAKFIAEHQQGSPLLYALLLGMALKSVINEETSLPGIGFSAGTVLRIGVALLGLRISLENVSQLGITSLVVIVVSVGLTVLVGVFLAKKLGLDGPFGILTGGATAICGASAALAISNLLPKHENSERDTSFTVVAVTSLATLSMIFYPPIITALGFTDAEAGYLIGGTIHDVAQVVGAGEMISPEAQNIATVTKLFRVALLIPVTLIIASYFHSPNGEARRVHVPCFLVLFVLFVALRSLTPTLQSTAGQMDMPFLVTITSSLPSVYQAASVVSGWIFAIAIAGVGLKTSLGDFKQFGWQAIALVVLLTAFITLFVGSATFLMH